MLGRLGERLRVERGRAGAGRRGAGSIRPTASFGVIRPSVDHVDRDLHRRRGGPLGRAGLEHVELAALDRELEVLDVAVVLLELLADPLELGVDRRHVGLHLADLRRGPDAGDDVLALGVGEVLAEEHLLAGVRVAGERDAGARVVAHVAVDHRHDVDRGAEVVGDLLVVAVVDGALAEPAGEDGLDGEVELLVRIAREVAAGVLADDPLRLLDDLAQGGGVEVGVLLRAVALLGGVEGVVEALGLHVHDDPAEHLDEPAVGVPAEPLVAGQRDQPVERLLVEPEVEDRVHHPGHRELGARADRDEERIGGVAEALAGPGLDLLDRHEDVVPEPVGELLAGREVVVAGLGRDREAGRHREPRVGHLGQAGALAAEQVAHRRVALGRPAAPGVDVALGGSVGTVGGRDGGLGHRNGSSGWGAAGARPRWGLFVSVRLYRRARSGLGCASVASRRRRVEGRPRGPSYGVGAARRCRRVANGGPRPVVRPARPGGA